MRYYRFILGRGNAFAKLCRDNNFIGLSYGIREDLRHSTARTVSAFKRSYRAKFLAARPGKNKQAQGHALHALWRFSREWSEDIWVFCPTGRGDWYVGKIMGDYYYQDGETLPHRRPVAWLEQTVTRTSMSVPLFRSSTGISAVSEITKHRVEIEKLIAVAKGEVQGEEPTRAPAPEVAPEHESERGEKPSLPHMAREWLDLLSAYSLEVRLKKRG